MILQADFLEPHLHGIVAFFNFMLIRLDFFESSAKGKLVCVLFDVFPVVYLFIANIGNRKSYRADETCRSKENNSR